MRSSSTRPSELTVRSWSITPGDIEPVTMADIKSYKSDGHGLSNGQVLPRPYKYQEARLVFREMIEVLCTDMFSKNLVSPACSWWVSYDYKSLEACPFYDGPLSIDFYGRLHPQTQ